MATVIERDVPSRSNDTYVERTTDSGTGWAVAAIVIIALLAVGAFIWAQNYNTPAATAPTAPNVNTSVTVPPTGATNDTGGNTTQPAPAASDSALPAQ